MHIKEFKGSDFKISDKAIYLKNVKCPGMLLIKGDYCGHCRRFLPTYQQLASKMDPNQFKITMLEISDMNPKMGEMLGLQGVPSLYFFDQSGKIIAQYDGPDRNLSTIENHICSVYHYCVRKRM